MASPTRAPREPLVIQELCVELERREGSLNLLQDVSIELERGAVLGLIGESGSGKTMTCRAAVGVLPHRSRITRGEVRIGGDVLRRPGLEDRRWSDLRVGMVFADPHASLDPLQKVGPQIAEMAAVHQRLGRRAARLEALRRLEEVRILRPADVYRQFPFELSGGMAQRAMIASVLAAKPHFLLADEPTSALDATVQLEILDLLKRLAAIEDVGILLTTHDMAVVARTCDRIGVMYAGRLVEIGPAQVVLSNPQHPYTRLLLHARPRGTRRERLRAIAGEPPVPGEAQDACPFAPRCPYAAQICREEAPPLARHGGSVAACHFVGKLPELAA